MSGPQGGLDLQICQSSYKKRGRQAETPGGTACQDPKGVLTYKSVRAATRKEAARQRRLAAQHVRTVLGSALPFRAQ